MFRTVASKPSFTDTRCQSLISSSTHRKPDWLAQEYDGTIRFWDATIETRPAAIVGHLGSTENMAFHPDGKSLASAGWGGIYLWDAASGRRLATIHTGHPVGASLLRRL